MGLSSGIRTIALSPEQVEQFRSEQRELVSMLEGARAWGPKGVRCARCWTYLDLPDDESKAAEFRSWSCSSCGATDWRPMPPLWPDAAIGFYAGCYVIEAVEGFAGVLAVRDGETITQALDRTVAEGRY